MYVIHEHTTNGPFISVTESLHGYPKNCLHGLEMYLMDVFYFNVVGMFSYSMSNNFTGAETFDKEIVKNQEIKLNNTNRQLPHVNRCFPSLKFENL